MHVVSLPPILSIRYAKCLIEKCERAIQSNEEEILFDLSKCSWADPFAITLLVGAIIGCAARDHKVRFRRPRKKKLEDHLASIGFYNWGGGTGVAGRFPHHQVELRHLKAVEPAYTDSIIGVLKRILTMSAGVRDSLHLSINELMTNTFDHSKTVDGCFICAQAYHSRGNVNICITDFGQGILKALSSVEQYAYLSDDVRAIEVAIREGVSSRIGRRAGLGLTHIHRFLSVNEGEAHIISGNGWVHWNYNRGRDVVAVTRKALKVAFEGTIVNIITRADGEGLYILSSESPEEDIF